MKNTGIKLLQVPYRGEAPALTAILAGEVDSAFVSVGGAVAQAEKAQTLAIANPARMRRYPDIPTFDEAGFPVLGLTGFSGFFAPAGIPKPVAGRLSKELREIVALPAVNSKLLDLGFED
ncbi:tripartite tricarboxylate transporter substrate binding protein, partial [Staphylococcus aureus]